MKFQKLLALAALWLPMLLAAGPATSAVAAAPRHAVTDDEIQLTLDRHAGQAEADREAIRALLRNPTVRRIAGAAGLDMERANAAAATLSGSSLANLAAQAREMNARLAGGDYIILSTSAIIIILLLIILLTR